METESTPPPRNKEQALSRLLLLGGLLLVAGALAIYHKSGGFQVRPQSATPNLVTPPAPVIPAIRGKPAAAFELPDIKGQTRKLADFHGKVLLVNFWATWCGPCLIELPWFVDFQKQYGPQGFEVIAISLDEDAAKVVPPFVEKHKFGTLTILLGEEKTPELFGGLLGLPTTFMVDRNGNYYSKHQGLVSKEDVESDILDLLPVGSPAPPAAGGSDPSSAESAPPQG
jgi:thiol-disulfide isomerase/thioredoxin